VFSVRDFPDLHPRQDDQLRTVVVSAPAALSALIDAALVDELAAAAAVTVSSAGAVDPSALGRVDLVVADVGSAGAAPTEQVGTLRRALPNAALLVLTGRSVTADYPALASGVDALLELDEGVLPDPYAVVAAARSALRNRSERVASRRYRQMAMDLLDASASATCIVDGSARVVAVNRLWPDFAAANGADPDSAGVGADYPEICRTAAGADADTALAAAQGLHRLLAGEIDQFDLVYASRWGGEDRWFRLEMAPLYGFGGAALTHVDVTAATQTALALSHLALHDALTELPNRNLLQDRLARALGLAAGTGPSVAVAVFDLDQFKRVNASLGHPAGDELLRAVARRLDDMALGTDTTSRIADDEFVAVRPGVDSVVEAELWAQQLLTVFDEPFPLELAGESVAMTASIGLYVGRAGQLPNELLQAADVAMRTAKADGPGRIRLYTDDLGRGAEGRLRTEHELRDGIAAGEFELYYQPVIDLLARTVVGVEALLRWSHPEGIRMPDVFIPLAEETGLIVPLGGWVIEQACRQSVAWAAEGLDLDMAVNLSARQVSHPGTIATIERALREAGMDPTRLLVEVTESAVVEDAEAAQRALAQVAALGVRIAIDDFGTGYSSLLYLKRYPIQALKVDRTFVSGMGISDDDDAIVASVVSLARAVGAVCIAEGVETHEQHALLLGLGCQYAQGYLFGRPVPAGALRQLTEDCNRRLLLPAPHESSGRTRRKLKVSPSAVRRIEQLHNSGASLHTIAAVLNRENAPTDHGGRWVSATVARVIASGRADGEPSGQPPG